MCTRVLLVFLSRTARRFSWRVGAPMLRIWYEAAGGNFITSTYYASEAPPWLMRWNRLRLPDHIRWKEMDPAACR